VADIAVNVTTTGRQVSPAIAMSANGAYVVAWTGVDAGDSVTPDEGIFAQLYDATGAVTKAEFAVKHRHHRCGDPAGRRHGFGR